MTRYSHLREISILPCLPAGLSVEDEMLSPTAPSFGLQHVYPNAALASVLGFLNISMAQFLALVESRKGIKLTSSKAHGPDTGPWRHRPENAHLWRALKVAHTHRSSSPGSCSSPPSQQRSSSRQSSRCRCASSTHGRLGGSAGGCCAAITSAVQPSLPSQSWSTS
jgi:hypothetical protein